PRDLIRGFEVRLQDRFLDVAPALVPAGVHVDGDQRFGFVDHNVTAAFQPHLAMERVIDLFLDPERLEDRRRPVVKLDPVPGPARNLAHHRIHPIDGAPVVAHHFVNFLGQKITHGALDQIRFFKNAARRRLIFDQLFDTAPLLDQHAEIPNEITRPLAFADCPDNHADALRNFEAAQNLPEPIALLRILDLARDTAAVAVRHKNEIAAGETQVRRDPRALRPDRTFRHLHDYVGTDRINARDVFRRD